MNELRFGGRIINGIGNHAELVIPGRNSIPECPADWPATFFPGSLNLLVSQYPDEFASHGLSLSTKSLDTGRFQPEFTIRQDMMLNNKLAPSATLPNRGMAQVWRACLEAKGHKVFCWVLRRLGSALENQIELVSAVPLRHELGLSRDREWPASVTMFGLWESRK